MGAIENDVTGSKHFIEHNGQTYMIDCGAWQGDAGANERNRNFSVSADKISSVIVSHAHFDHTGLLPKLVKDGYNGKIYSTPATRDLASIILLDSAKIQKHEKSESAYEESDVIKTMNLFRCHFYHKHKKINDDVSFTFYDAGHILGSALIDIELKRKSLLSRIFKKEPIHFLYACDLGRESNPIVNPPETCMPAPDYIVLESTYGNRLHAQQSQIDDDLTKIINDTISKRGKVLIPSFAVERAQEIIYHIKILMRDNKIPRIPVYIDSPMASNATGVFNIHPECMNENISRDFLSKGKNPFSVNSLRCVSDYKESVELAKSKVPCIIIASSGMCEAGRVINHLKEIVSNKNNSIIMVGYAGENTLGRKIADKEEILHIEKEDYKLKADVYQISAFSSHSDYNETIEWLSKIDTSKLKKIFLVHGNLESKEFLQKLLKDKGYSVKIADGMPVVLN